MIPNADRSYTLVEPSYDQDSKLHPIHEGQSPRGACELFAPGYALLESPHQSIMTADKKLGVVLRPDGSLEGFRKGHQILHEIICYDPEKLSLVKRAKSTVKNADGSVTIQSPTLIVGHHELKIEDTGIGICRAFGYSRHLGQHAKLKQTYSRALISRVNPDGGFRDFTLEDYHAVEVTCAN